jgi:membrane-bound inhibitor of C-type lysozyme
MKSLALTALAAVTIATATFAAAPDAEAAGLRYNCQNGPELTVIFNEPNETRLRYVYDGPDSAMRTMRVSPNNPRRYSDGRATITLRPNRATVEYREADFFDRCTAYHGF